MDKDFLVAITQFVTAAFGLAAGLAWNSAIQDTINLYIPQDGGILGKFFYALIITIMAVLVTRNLSRLSAKSKTND